MYAEMSITINNNLEGPVLNEFINFYRCTGSKNELMKKAGWSVIALSESVIVHKENAHYFILISKENDNELKMHIQYLNIEGSLSSLKYFVIQEFKTLNKNLKKRKISTEETKVFIDSTMTLLGERVKFWDVFWKYAFQSITLGVIISVLNIILNSSDLVKSITIVGLGLFIYTILIIIYYYVVYNPRVVFKYEEMK